MTCYLNKTLPKWKQTGRGSMNPKMPLQDIMPI